MRVRRQRAASWHRLGARALGLVAFSGSHSAFPERSKILPLPHPLRFLGKKKRMSLRLFANCMLLPYTLVLPCLCRYEANTYTVTLPLSATRTSRRITSRDYIDLTNSML